jgi:thioredoxin reductase (NADPH)
MTDDTNETAGAGGNGRTPGSPFGGLTIASDERAPGDAAPTSGGAFGGLAINSANDASGAAAPVAGPPPEAPPTPLADGGGPTADALEGAGPHHAKVVILGSGPAGLTAAIYAARANLEPIVLAGSTPGGQLMITSDFENYPGFVDAIDGPELMARFRGQAERFGTRFADVDVDRVDFSGRPFGIWASGVEYRAEAVVVATGASALWLGLESETRLRGRGVSACATCDGFFFRDREIAVVGGGDTAMEEATFLTRFASKVHLLHRRESFRASKIMVDRAQANPKIEVHLNTAVDEVLGDSRVEGLRVRDTDSGETRDMSMDGLFVAIGYKPNTDVFRDWLEVDAMGYLVVRDETGSQVEGVFIAGDVHDHRYRQAVTAAADGCKAAIDAERWLEAQGVHEASTATAW